MSIGILMVYADLSEEQMQFLTDLFLLSFTLGGVLVGIAGHLYDAICEAERLERQRKIQHFRGRVGA
ncbi:hypothetical protein [Pontibacter mangrovi]|uniref:Uncharacterized protein n=1 Tax=Pontibacter mangrovi TaxID=2589816 RepID=A0A501WCL3_9BACT|nr:hypothetical protein [Pontibacter mangrovi]TPE44961.1 hypothetical protein FJM65_08065 [Pontibacter mangrovi]